MTEQNHSGSGHNINVEGDAFFDSSSRLNSDLSSVLNILSKSIFVVETENGNDATIPFNPEEKIRHNNVIKFKDIIESYKSYVGKLSSIYKAYDSEGTNKTHIVLENIKLAYLKEKSRLLLSNTGKEEMEVIRENADELIDKVEQILLQQVRTSANIDTSTESINLTMQIVLIDAFIRCKILEEPN